jgi:hypothetical protein
MTPDERKMVSQLVTRPGQDNSADAITRRKEEFARQFRPWVSDRMKLTLELLERACAERNATDVEYTLVIGFSFGFSSAHLDALMRLADADWHHRHEDVVSALDKLRDRRAVDILYRSALKRHEYLAFDDARALAVKAIWALGKLSDAAADEKLRLLAQSDEIILREQAMIQLERRAALQRKI